MIMVMVVVVVESVGRVSVLFVEQLGKVPLDQGRT